MFARGKNGNFYLASDANALAKHVHAVTYLEDGDIVHILNGKSSIRASGNLVERSHVKLDTEKLHVDKGSFAHFMLKEIYEAPEVITDVLR